MFEYMLKADWKSWLQKLTDEQLISNYDKVTLLLDVELFVESPLVDYGQILLDAIREECIYRLRNRSNRGVQNETV